MTDRQEPTISGLKVDADDPRLRQRSTTQSPKAGARAPASAKPTPRATAAPVRPVVVRSRIAPIAFLFALLALGAAGYLGWQFFEAQKLIVAADARIVSLEEKLMMSDDETTASAAAMQASLKEAHSEIRKLWGVSYDRNRKSIEANEKNIASAKSSATKASERANALSGEVRLVSDLVDAQQNALTEIEKSNASISAQTRAMNEKTAIIDQRIAEINSKIDLIEQDIDAINGFRRSVNQELLQLRSGASGTP